MEIARHPKKWGNLWMSEDFYSVMLLMYTT